MDLKDYRKDFTSGELTVESLNDNPFLQFEQWFQQADQAQLTNPNAMSLATVSSDGQPSIRTVLLKVFDEKGFVFFTNYGSKKAKEISQNQKVALLFFWQGLERQVKITGQASKISAAESASYFLSRPRGSQIGAWCSNQSDIISSRQLLRSKFEEFKQKFKNKDVPFPSFWGGYRVKPDSFEFWQGRQNRLHDRFRYLKLENESWEVNRLAP